MASMVQAVLEPSSLMSVIFFTILVSAQAVETYCTFLPFFQWVSKSLWPLISGWVERSIAVQKNAIRVAQDFRSGRFYLPWGRKEPIIVRDRELMQELSEAPQLSQRAVYADIFGFEHTMNHTHIDFNPNEQTTGRYRLFARVIRVIGMSQISDLQPFLQAKLEETLNEEIDSQSTVDGWKPVKLASLMRKSASGMLGVYFFGKNMSQEPEFEAAMVRYYKDVINCMGALQLVPKFMTRFVYAFITNRGRALDVIFKRLKLAIDPNQQGWDEDESIRKMTLFYNLIKSSEGSRYWTDNALIQAVIGIWFAASHQPWINLHFIFLELCARPEYIQQLRDEIGSQGLLDYTKISTLPLLDSFIKETVRLNPLDKMAIRRKALEPFRFSNGGPQIAVGEIACVSAWDIMQNEEKYPAAHEFDGHRYLENSLANSKSPQSHNDSMRGTFFTDASQDFPIWGYGSKVCPGRWHAAIVMKMIIVHLIMIYDFRLQDENTSHKWFWETFQMPYESTKVLFRKRISK